MTKPTETPWFPGHIKPVHVGVYKRRLQDKSLRYSRWSGTVWHLLARTAFDAANELNISGSQCLDWRGLTEQPK